MAAYCDSCPRRVMIRGRGRATIRIIAHPALGARILISRAYHHDFVLDVRSASAPPAARQGLSWVDPLGLHEQSVLCPRALLVCLGTVGLIRGTGRGLPQTWALRFGMAGYTLLLAVSACLLVRFVGVWDDVRTVLLLVVLMFLATSVTFDDVLSISPERGVVCYLGGLLFAVAGERGDRCGRSDLACRHCSAMPCHRDAQPYSSSIPMAITPAAGLPSGRVAVLVAVRLFARWPRLAFLALLPAVRRGRDYVRGNGSPWGWAWYPWALFGVLGLRRGGAVRPLLCFSMHHIPPAETEPLHLRALLPGASRPGDERDSDGDPGWSRDGPAYSTRH